MTYQAPKVESFEVEEFESDVALALCSVCENNEV